MTVQSVTATAPLTSSGGDNPNVALTVPLSAVYGGTGSTRPSLILGWYNVREFGAKGDGVTDDSAAITSALNAAIANASCLYFPPGNYFYNSATPINIAAAIIKISIFAAGNAIITGGPSSTNCFVISGEVIGNGGWSTPWVLPSVQNFTNGAAIVCTDGTSAFQGPEIHISYIANCHDGILLTSGSAGASGVFQAWIVFSSISKCIYGIRFQSRSSSKDSIQGSSLVGGLIYDCTNGVAFDGQVAISTAAVIIPAIGSNVTIPVDRSKFRNGDPVVVGGALAVPTFLGTITAGAGTTSLTVQVTGFVPTSVSYVGQTMPANIGVNGYYSQYSSVNSINTSINGVSAGETGINILGGIWQQTSINCGTSFFGFAKTTVSQNYGQFWNSTLIANWFYVQPPQQYDCMAAFSSPLANFNNGNVFGSTYSALAPDTYTASTAPNTRNTFNGGVPIQFPSFRIKMVCPAMTVGQVADFYVYSWFTTAGPASVRFLTNNFSAAPVVLQCCEDESGTVGSSANRNNNEIHIRIIALGTVTSGSVVYGRVDVGV